MPTPVHRTELTPSPSQEQSEAEREVRPPEQKKAQDLLSVLRDGDDEQIKARIKDDIETIVSKFPFTQAYCLLSLYDPKGSIDSGDANNIFTALQQENANRTKNVFLLIASPGGQIESAYQISKLCKSFASRQFVVAVPGVAKSAATLLALGADEIHMAMLGQLGPIDPQLGGLPALGVKQALETIASICQQYPGSSNAFAKYLTQRVTIEQIGYCERVAESAVQYAERLLAKKEQLRPSARQIAHDLVYLYKEHGFLIDVEEAQARLGDSWIIADSLETKFGSQLYQYLSTVNVLLGFLRDKRVSVVGSLRTGVEVWDEDQHEDED